MKKTIGYLVFLTMAACSTLQCKKDQSMAAPKKDTVFVAKADGSKQCGMGKKIELDTMEKQLSDIKTYSRSSKSDGLMRPQVCGAGTGYHNVYEIDAKDLQKAKSLGFKKWEMSQ